MRKPSRPIQAVARCKPGFSKTLPILPIFPRKDVRVKSMKKMTEKTSETAMNAGVVAVGAVSKSGALLGSTERSGGTSAFAPRSYGR